MESYLARLKPENHLPADIENAVSMFTAMGAAKVKSLFAQPGVIRFDATAELAASIGSLPSVASVHGNVQMEPFSSQEAQ